MNVNCSLDYDVMQSCNLTAVETKLSRKPEDHNAFCLFKFATSGLIVSRTMCILTTIQTFCISRIRINHIVEVVYEKCASYLNKELQC